MWKSLSKLWKRRYVLCTSGHWCEFCLNLQYRSKVLLFILSHWISHDMMKTSVCRFSCMSVSNKFRLKSNVSLHFTEKNFPHCLCSIFNHFRLYLKLSTFWLLDVISAARKNVKPCAADYWGLSYLGIHVACLSRKSYSHYAHLKFEWRISNTKIVSYQFINTA